MLISANCTNLEGSSNFYTLWVQLMDTVGDMDGLTTMNAFIPETLKEKNYTYSCTSPFVLHSLILCFGHKLDLPCLQRVLLEVFWSATDEMVRRIGNLAIQRVLQEVLWSPTDEMDRRIGDLAKISNLTPEHKDRLYLGMLTPTSAFQFFPLEICVRGN